MIHNYWIDLEKERIVTFCVPGNYFRVKENFRPSGELVPLPKLEQHSPTRFIKWLAISDGIPIKGDEEKEGFSCNYITVDESPDDT